MRSWTLLSGLAATAIQVGTQTGRPAAGPVAPPVSRSDALRPGERAYLTPRMYQRRFGSGRIFEAMAYREALAARQPAAEQERRSAMAAAIRAAILQAGSTIGTESVDRAVAAIGRVKREAFVPPAERRYAYLPFPARIGHGQTISDAYIVTLMTAVGDVGPGDAVLDVGTGSGYQAAVLAALGADVTSIEIVEPLAAEARARLRHLGYRNVMVVTGDGYRGVPRNAPYDAIVVAAGTGAPPRALLDQLKIGGRLVIPIGATFETERLILYRRTTEGYSSCSLGEAGFVPMTGMAGKVEPPSSRVPALCFDEPVT